VRNRWLVPLLTFACASTGLGQSVCVRQLLTPSDVAGILSEPITGMKDIPNDAQSCNFVTASFPSITVMLRPGKGKETVREWASGQILPSTPFTGVGDRAVWVADSKEIVADKNNILCDISVQGASASAEVAEERHSARDDCLIGVRRHMNGRRVGEREVIR